MTATEAALERGREVAAGKHTVDGIEFRGRLCVRIDGELVHEQGGALLYYQPGRSAEGKPTVHEVRGALIRRIARAVIQGPDKDDVLVEAFQEARAQSARKGGKGRRTKRGRT